MKKVIAVFGTMDTKGEEYFYLKDQLEQFGAETLLIDTGITPDPRYPCSVGPEEVAVAGGSSLEEIKKHDRLYSFEIMGNGSAAIILRLCKEKKIQ